MTAKIGFKFYPGDITEKLLKAVSGKVDFIELLAMERTGRKTLKLLAASGIPMTVHSMHLDQGVNLANYERKDKNTKSLRLAVEMADYFRSDVIIVHPGEMENAECRVENSVWMFRSIGDRRLLVENMPYSEELPRPEGKTIEFFCRTPAEVATFMKSANCGLCLDIGHATAAAHGLGVDYISHIKGFLELKPGYFHLQDSVVNSNVDSHLHFGSGDMDLPEIFKLLPKDAMLCLETAHDIEGRLKDILFLKENI